MMKNMDVEIYISQFITFFEKNPNELISLIGQTDKDEFFAKVESQCYKNLEKGDDVEITRNQILDILVDIHKDEIKTKKVVDDIFIHTKFGDICMN